MHYSIKIVVLELIPSCMIFFCVACLFGYMIPTWKRSACFSALDALTCIFLCFLSLLHWNSLEVDIDDGPFGSELGIHNWVCKAGSFRDAVDS